MDFGKQLSLVRKRAPLVQCITNFVTVNDCANIILAAGGSPSMADDVREAAEAVRGSAALVCNLGAIAEVDAMVSAGKAANELGKPVVLDPVAAGNTALRRQESARLLVGVKFAAIRGNASEIRALARGELTGSGVDVSGEDAVSDATLPRTVETARLLAKQTGAVVAVSGPIDVVTDGGQTILLRNGCATMARITGSGCMLTSMLGAFCGADRSHPFEATCAAIAAMGVAGDLAEERRLRNGTGNATFRTDLIDAVFNLTEEQLNGRVRYEVYEG
ncbi:hydroxyethylthiazole kinase [Oscillibacter sp.]|uniref:hydroxyethylthiazole kinase n=1 Tax=Oscillibacter sp. TaxID=1945593 RepID=UPI001B47725B|nr:hydroxyethylthiazole kinase [Oscillibacter sp.]MBP3510081.1 hydroxyethylthiazole kinase [Oscillibacter sp.]